MIMLNSDIYDLLGNRDIRMNRSGYSEEQQKMSIYKDTRDIEVNVGKAALDYIKETGAHVYGMEEGFHLDIQVRCTQGNYVAHFESKNPIEVDQLKAVNLLQRFGDLHSWKGCPGRGQDYEALFNAQFECEMELKKMGCTEITSIAGMSMVMC